MNFTDQAIVITLGSVAAKHAKPFCFPSQNHILVLLKKFHNIHISPRTLNRHLKSLQLDLFFERVRRHRRGKDGKIIFNTTLYKLKKKFFNFAAFMRFQGSKIFSLFRLPKAALYRGKTPQGLGFLNQERRLQTEIGPEEGGGVRRTSGNQATVPLVRLRELLKGLVKSS